MGRLQLALLVFVLAVSAAIVSASENSTAKVKAEAPATNGGSDGEAPVDNNTIGTTDDGGDNDDGAAAPSPDDDDVVVPGPIGSESSYSNYPPAQPTGSAAIGGVSAVTGFVAVAGSLFFF
ncbi:PREDICTED: anther-specific protein BCP1-like [Tarenaya hassleriana]|uniref:anther-specific protein BCP1-like n=1 Tax=Tarenaya hassleriana TaxID=28532 RepID=UPI00053C46FC|nr:PREDICTED: anther-specific protein BCP1-like [Tarenaya hassleriana]